MSPKQLILWWGEADNKHTNNEINELRQVLVSSVKKIKYCGRG